MRKRSHGWFLLLGGLLLAAALLLALRVTRAPGAAQAGQTLRLEQAVTELEGGCLACHRTLTAPPAALRIAPAAGAVSPFDVQPPRPAETASPSSQPVALQAPLRDLGQRLLTVPAVNPAARSAAVDAYLEVYGAARAAGPRASAVERGALLGRLAALERAVRDLEQRANPVRFTRASSSEIAPVAAAPGAPPQAPVFALALALLLGALLPPRAWTRLAAVVSAAPSFGVLFAAHRRGPPLGGAHLESVWSGRLPVM